MNDQDSLSEEQQKNGGTDTPTKQNDNNSMNTTELINEKKKDHEDLLDESIMTDTTEQTKSILNQSKQNNEPLTYDIKQLTLEVIQQIKSDLTKLINFVAPKELRDQIKTQINEHVIPFVQQKVIPMIQEHIIPSIKSTSLVMKEWGVTTFDMVRRYVGAFVSNKMDVDGRDTTVDDTSTPTATEAEGTTTQN